MQPSSPPEVPAAGPPAGYTCTTGTRRFLVVWPWWLPVCPPFPSGRIPHTTRPGTRVQLRNSCCLSLDTNNCPAITFVNPDCWRESSLLMQRFRKHENKNTCSDEIYCWWKGLAGATLKIVDMPKRKGHRGLANFFVFNVNFPRTSQKQFRLAAGEINANPC